MRSAWLLLALVACRDESEPPRANANPAATPAPNPGAAGAPLRFVDATREAGLEAPTWCGRPEKPHILESGGAGLALFDREQDGDLDLFLVNGWRLAGEEVLERGRDVLYANRGDGTFLDESTQAGIADEAWGTGAEVGDVDGDGDTDVFVSNFGPDALLLNRGDGRFAPAANAPGFEGWSTGAALFDAERDGDLDLFVAGYIACSREEVLAAEPTLDWRGHKVMPGPFGLAGAPDRFFLNDGHAGFADATRAAGLEDVGLYYGFGVIALDLDEDLDLDLYVANDSNPNYVYRNDGSGRFQEMGLWSGAALDKSGLAQAGMGVVAGDVDRDGRPDLVVTHFALDASTLYANLGNCLFEDRTARAGLKDPTYAPLEWGAALEDLDLDGRLDLALACGHIYPEAELFPEELIGYRQPALVLLGSESGFVDVSAQAGPGFAPRRASRGLAAGDLDGDGDVDLVLSNMDAPPTLLRNDSARRGAWLLVDAPGAMRVELRAGELTLVRHAIHGGSFCSASDRRFHFGLGALERVDELVVVWPDGERTVRRDVTVEQVVWVTR